MASNRVKCSNCNIVINEVLAFVNNKIDIMDEESISRICVSAFSENDIVIAKNLLFESIPTLTKQKKTRKRDGKTLRNIDDIICALKESDPEEVPIFVARELQKLPPILFDHVDVTKILKDLMVMQQDIRGIKEHFVTTEQLDILKYEMEMLKHSSDINRYERNINTRRGACRRGSFEDVGDSMGSQVADASVNNQSNILSSPETVYCEIVQNNFPTVGTSVSMPTNTQPSPSLNTQSEVNNPSTSNFQPYSIQDKCQNPVVSRNIASERTCSTSEPMSQPTQLIAPAATCELRHSDGTSGVPTSGNENRSMADIVKEGEWKYDKRGDDWITVQRRRYRNRFAVNRGKAVLDTSVNFKAAEIKVPIYIYNVAKDVPVCDITKYVASKSNVNITVEKMNMKSEKEYNSYKIFVPKEKAELFLQDDFWPVGIAYRRFVEFRYRHRTVTALQASETNRPNPT